MLLGKGKAELCWSSGWFLSNLIYCFLLVPATADHLQRFRPNIVFQGGGPFAEDAWEEITIGSKSAPRITLVSKCTRCLVSFCSTSPLLSSICFHLFFTFYQSPRLGFASCNRHDGVGIRMPGYQCVPSLSPDALLMHVSRRNRLPFFGTLIATSILSPHLDPSYFVFHVFSQHASSSRMCTPKQERRTRRCLIRC